MLFGFIGGLGPHASTKFLETIYTIRDTYSNEQELPRVILLSDPYIPNRTEMLLSGKEKVLYENITSNIEKLIAFGADQIFILCFTFHYFIEELNKKYKNVISLIDIALKEILHNKRRHLLLGTLATYQLGIFEKSIYWDKVKDFIVSPSPADQENIYTLIHQIKVGKKPDSQLFNELKALMSKYEVKCLLAGCTEFHLISSSPLLDEYALRFLDPLNILANEIAYSKNNLVGAA